LKNDNNTPNENNTRRQFLKSAAAGSAMAAVAAPQAALAQSAAPAKPAANAQPAPLGYAYLNPEEVAFVEALVDHMIPADALTPKGTDLGVNIYIDRALAGSWGKGDRLYMQGPWKPGVPQQGYQSPLTPAELYRVGIQSSNAYCQKTWGRPFDRLSAQQREEFLRALDGGKIVFENGPPSRVFWNVVYQTVMEGMFADPIYGGNKDKAGWKMVGFPGVAANHRNNIVTFRDKRYTGETTSIADLS
jgi:gluconate 2-dehydrogenase gamma chain